MHEDPEAVIIATSELEVVVRRSPLLLEFRDAKTHALIDADAQPMAYDSQGLLKSRCLIRVPECLWQLRSDLA
jgi:hypothetical protein